MTAIDTSGVKIEKDVVFAQGRGHDLLCDVYRPPAGTSKRTAIVHLHGGGFRGGSKEGARTARPLAGLGYVSVASQYRLSGEAKWPAQIEDTKAAVRWVRSHASDLDVYPTTIVVCGYSAGAQLALVAAGSQEAGAELAACVAFYPPISTERRPDGSVPELMEAAATDEELRAASPTTYLGASFPPTILLHGTADKAVPFANSLQVFQTLLDAGVPVELHALEGLDHVFDTYPEFADLSARAIDLFIDRHVVDPRPYPGTLGRPAAVGAAP